MAPQIQYLGAGTRVSFCKAKNPSTEGKRERKRERKRDRHHQRANDSRNPLTVTDLCKPASHQPDDAVQSAPRTGAQRPTTRPKQPEKKRSPWIDLTWNNNRDLTPLYQFMATFKGLKASGGRAHALGRLQLETPLLALTNWSILVVMLHTRVWSFSVSCSCRIIRSNSFSSHQWRPNTPERQKMNPSLTFIPFRVICWTWLLLLSSDYLSSEFSISCSCKKNRKSWSIQPSIKNEAAERGCPTADWNYKTGYWNSFVYWQCLEQHMFRCHSFTYHALVFPFKTNTANLLAINREANKSPTYETWPKYASQIQG